MTSLRTRLALIMSERDSGYVAVFVALCLPLLVGMCALAVDVATWHVEGTKAQKAADAAALGGTIYLPTSQSTAFSTATDLARVNGFSSANGDVVTVARTTKPTQLRVTITTTVNNSFGVIFGRKTTKVTRTSVADYAGPIPMGSPCNVFGNEQMESSSNRVASSKCDGQAGVFWVNIAGTRTNKARGDAFESGYCTNPSPSPTIDRCDRVTGSASSPIGTTTNTEYNQNKDPVTGQDLGYLYGVRVSRAGINLDIQGYDMSWVAQGDACDMSTMNGATAARNNYVTDETTRYAKGKTAFCAGDSSMDTPEGDGNTSGGNSPSKVTTIVNVYEPSTTPWKPLDAPLVCSLTLNGFDDTTNLSKALNIGPGYIDEVARYFHRWETLCHINGAKLGDYTVQVRTVGGGGQNRFAMRVDAGAASSQVSMFAQGKTSFYNSVPAGTSVFYLARLDSGAAGKILDVDFFDLADADDPVDVTVLKPDSNTPFSSCNQVGPPIVDSDPGSPITNCTIRTTNAGNNGRWVRIAVNVPVNYTCSNDADNGVCWVRVRLNTAGGQNDTTTWSASLQGDPVRIVE